MSVTINNEFKAEFNKIKFNSPNPITNAPILYLLVNNPSLKIDSRPRQLNPWNKRAKQSVANASVAANP